MRPLYLFLYVGARVTASAVHNLSGSNFSSFVEGHELSLIAFIAPWCVHCQDLKPELESAATGALAQGWPVARVDCDEDKDLCKEYRIVIYPTLHVFHHGEHSIYNGHRKADAILSTLRRHSQPLVTPLSSVPDVAEFRTKDRVTVVGYFDEADHPSKAAFSKAAKTYRDDYLFGSISDPTFGEVEHVRKPSVVLYKTFDEGKNVYTGEFDSEKLENFIIDAATPLIREIDVDLSFFPTKAAVPLAVIFAETKEERAQLTTQLRPVAEASKDQIVWVVADPIQYAQRASEAALEPGEWPAFAIEDHANDFKFAFPRRGSVEDLSVNAIHQVVDDFLAGRLRSSILNDPAQVAQDGSVRDNASEGRAEVLQDLDTQEKPVSETLHDEL